MTTTLNLNFSKAEDWTIDFVLTDENDAVLDITGAEVEWVMKADELVLASVANGRVVINDAANGGGRINVPAADTAPVSLGVQEHFCRLTMGDSSKSVQFNGNIRVREAPGVTP